MRYAIDRLNAGFEMEVCADDFDGEVPREGEEDSQKAEEKPEMSFHTIETLLKHLNATSE